MGFRRPKRGKWSTRVKDDPRRIGFGLERLHEAPPGRAPATSCPVSRPGTQQTVNEVDFSGVHPADFQREVLLNGCRAVTPHKCAASFSNSPRITPE